MRFYTLTVARKGETRMPIRLEERIDTLETILGQFIVSTNVALLRMERGNEAFKDEMGAFKDG